MSKIQVVKINTEYVEQFLAKHEISGMEFSNSLCYSDSWWAGIKNENKSVKPNVARLICSLYKLDYETLLLTPPETGSEPEAKAEPLSVDGEVVEAFGKRLERVEAKLDKLLTIWG